MVWTKSKIFLYWCLSFCLGVGAARFVQLPASATVAIIGIMIGIAVVQWPMAVIRVAAGCVVFVVIGMVRFHCATHVPTVSDIDFYNGQPVRFLSYIAGEPDTRQNSIKLTVRTLRIADREPVTGRVLVTVPMYPEYRYGDLLEIYCELESPGLIEPDDSSGRTFDYGAYLSRYDVYSVCYRPTSVELRGHGYGNWFIASLLNVKNRFVAATQDILAEPYASLLGGILLGAKKAMPEDLMNVFNRTGITHIVALSGFNITIIAVALSALGQRLSLPRRVSFWSSCIAIGLFVVMTGAQASAVRAGVMGGLVMVGRELGRLSRITSALVCAAALMLLVNPHILLFDTGFQLSFLATLGLVYLSPFFEKWFAVRFVPAWLSSTLAATMSAICFTAPLMAYQFGRFSLVAPLVNVLIVPLIPLTMGIGFGAVALALACPPLGQVAGWFVGLLLRYVVGVAQLFSGFGFSSLAIDRLSWIWPVAWYAAMIVGLFLHKRMHRQSV